MISDNFQMFENTFVYSEAMFPACQYIRSRDINSHLESKIIIYTCNNICILLNSKSFRLIIVTLIMNLQNPPAGYLAVSKGHPGEAAPKKLSECIIFNLDNSICIT